MIVELLIVFWFVSLFIVFFFVFAVVARLFLFGLISFLIWFLCLVEFAALLTSLLSQGRCAPCEFLLALRGFVELFSMMIRLSRTIV